jgi:hypothetical protein
MSTPSPIQYTDADGNPITLKTTPRYTDVDGNPTQLTAKAAPPPSSQDVRDLMTHSAAQLVPGALTGTGSVLGEMADPVGGGILGAAAGSAAGEFLKSRWPEMFGEGAKDVTELLKNVGVDAATQAVTGGLGKVAQAAGRASGVVGKVGGALSEIPGINKLPGVEVAQAAEDAFHQTAYEKLMALKDAHDNQKIVNAVAEQINPNSDIPRVKDLYKASQKAVTNAENTRKKAQQEFDTHAVGGPQLPPEEPPLLSMRTGGKFLLKSALAGMGAHMLGLGPAAEGATSGLILTASQVSKLARSPQLGAAILTAQKTSSNATAVPLIQRLILHNLVGESVDLEDGRKATVGADGQLEPQAK